MSDGRKHERNAKIAIGIFLPIFLCLAFYYPFLGLGGIFGLICGFIYDPDLDHRGTTRAEYRFYKFLGFLGIIPHMYWTPYQEIFHHRSTLSHGGKGLRGFLIMGFFGTPIRVLYSYLWIVPFYKYLRFLIDARFLLFLLGQWAGWAIQDWVHWLRDYIGGK